MKYLKYIYNYLQDENENSDIIYSQTVDIQGEKGIRMPLLTKKNNEEE